MKHEAEFGTFLKTVKRSSKTQEPFSTKVASDTVSRCKSLEKALNIELSPKTVGSDESVNEIIQTIKAARLGASEARPYAHNEHILAVRIYKEFIASRDAQ